MEAIIINKEEALVNLRSLKLHYPFRQWFTANIKGEWHFYSSKQKLYSAARKAGAVQIDIFSL